MWIRVHAVFNIGASVEFIFPFAAPCPKSVVRVSEVQKAFVQTCRVLIECPPF